VFSPSKEGLILKAKGALIALVKEVQNNEQRED